MPVLSTLAMTPSWTEYMHRLYCSLLFEISYFNYSHACVISNVLFINEPKAICGDTVNLDFFLAQLGW